MQELYKRFKGEMPEEKIQKKLGSSRDYCVDLIPKFLMSCGKLSDILYITGVTNYL